jgi:hypothetical protein
MIATEKIRELLQQLLEKSRANQVYWRIGSHRSYVKRNVFVQFPESSIHVVHVSPPTEADVIYIVIYNEGGKEVARWEVTEDDRDWELASDLVAEAHRYVTNWDKVLEDVEKAVHAQGPIGVPPPEEIPF